MMKQDDIDNRIDKLISQSEKEIERLFSHRLKVIKALLEDMFEKYESSEASVTWTNFNKYNRLNKELDRITEMMNDDYKVVAKTIKQSQQNVYIEKYMMSLFLYELASQSDMHVTIPSISVIQESIDQPIEFIKLIPTLQKQRNSVLEKIRMHITQGIMSGEGYSKVSKALRDDIGMSVAQSKRVARTEIGRALSIAGQDSALKARDNGVEMTKYWLATKDTRTRDTHQDLDGQEKGLDEPFKSSGCIGMSPKTFVGVASAKENINCRCKLLYLIDGEKPDVMRVRNEDGSSSVVDFQTYEEWLKTKEKGY